MRTITPRTCDATSFRAGIQKGTYQSAMHGAMHYTNREELYLIAESVFPVEVERIKSVVTAALRYPATMSGKLRDIGFNRSKAKNPTYYRFVSAKLLARLEEFTRTNTLKSEVAVPQNPSTSLEQRVDEALARQSKSWLAQHGLTQCMINKVRAKKDLPRKELAQITSALDDAQAAPVSAHLALSLRLRDKPVLMVRSTPADPIILVPAGEVRVQTPNPRPALIQELIMAARDPQLYEVMTALAALRKKFNGKTETALELLVRMEEDGVPLSVFEVRS